MLMEEEKGDLFTAEDYWGPEAWLAQIGWMAALGYEGGLFVTIGQRR